MYTETFEENGWESIGEKCLRGRSREDLVEKKALYRARNALIVESQETLWYIFSESFNILYRGVRLYRKKKTLDRESWEM